MISVNQAKEILKAHCERGAPKEVNLRDSLGYYVAEDIRSPMDVPSFDNSAMDGYAMHFSQERKSWQVVSNIAAGDTSQHRLSEGEASRIFTGAKMPVGADTVIQQELIVREGDNSITYSGSGIQSGKNVRLKGTQCKKGQLILEKGAKISPGTIGLLASVGVDVVKVFEPPRLAYLITGNELKELGEPLKEGEIYNSNGPMLAAFLSQQGITRSTALKASDTKEELQETINKALENHEVLILSGGISVGDYDFVKECLEASGVTELFYKVKQRPGKPFYAGKKGRKWIFALPGNPASVLSCYVQYVRPCLRYWMGQEQVWEPDAILPLAEAYTKKPGFTFFAKGRKTNGQLEVLQGQQSFNLQAFNQANCLIELPEEEEKVSKGNLVKVFNL